MKYLVRVTFILLNLWLLLKLLYWGSNWFYSIIKWRKLKKEVGLKIAYWRGRCESEGNDPKARARKEVYEEIEMKMSNIDRGYE